MNITFLNSKTNDDNSECSDRGRMMMKTMMRRWINAVLWVMLTTTFNVRYDKNIYFLHVEATKNDVAAAGRDSSSASIQSLIEIGNSTTATATTGATTLHEHRPRIYTYYEQMDTSFDGYANGDDDLLSFWKDSWYSAGFHPVVLNRTHYDRSFAALQHKEEKEIMRQIQQQQKRQQGTNTSLAGPITSPRLKRTTELLQGLLPRLDLFSQALFRRWVAVSTLRDEGDDNGVGVSNYTDTYCCWYSDYDNFPIRNVSYFKEIVGATPLRSLSSSSLHSNSTTPHHTEDYAPFFLKLPNNGQMTLHDIMSPTLATGTPGEWMKYLHVILRDATQRIDDGNHVHDENDEKINWESHTSGDSTPSTLQKSTFWTDTLSFISLRDRKMGFYNQPLPAYSSLPSSLPFSSFEIPASAKSVAIPYGRIDPVVMAAAQHDNNKTDLCHHRQWRSKWTVHFSPNSIQGGLTVPPSKRHPQYRKELAEEWLKGWNSICGSGG